METPLFVAVFLPEQYMDGFSSLPLLEYIFRPKNRQFVDFGTQDCQI